MKSPRCRHRARASPIQSQRPDPLFHACVIMIPERSRVRDTPVTRRHARVAAAATSPPRRSVTSPRHVAVTSATSPRAHRTLIPDFTRPGVPEPWRSAGVPERAATRHRPGNLKWRRTVPDRGLSPTLVFERRRRVLSRVRPGGSFQRSPRSNFLAAAVQRHHCRILSNEASPVPSGRTAAALSV